MSKLCTPRALRARSPDNPDAQTGLVCTTRASRAFRRWGVKYGFIDFLEHFSVPQANGRARCILGNRPVERF